MRFHLVAMPHTKVTDDFCGCAYTAKVKKFTKMMGEYGYDITLYAPEGSDCSNSALVEILSDQERLEIFGADDPSTLPNWPSDEQFALFNNRVIDALKENVSGKDIVLLTAGYSHKPIADALPNLLFCEPGVGYEGVFTDKCAFESYAWMHYVYGKNGITDGRWFDCVIPNYFDTSQFTAGSGDGGYLLYLGRLIHRKGVETAALIAQESGMPLIVAGAGQIDLPGDVEFVGPVGVEERNKLMGGALALIAPTYYIEPFGGVAVEAMLTGTPVITTDWGAFSETVIDGVTGYRFRSLQHGVDAVWNSSFLERSIVSSIASERFSLESVAPQFDKWFHHLGTLWDNGWYQRLENLNVGTKSGNSISTQLLSH